MENNSSERILADLKDGESGIITSIAGGKKVTKRLADLGLKAGTRITVIRKTLFSGPAQVEVCGSRLVIGQGMASKITVLPK